MLFYLKSKNNGSALISVLILLAFASSLLVVFLNIGKQGQKQIGQFQKNNTLFMQIHAVEDFAIDILNIDYQNSPNITHKNENWGNKIQPFPIGSYTVSLEIEDLQSKLNVNDLIKGTSEINFIQLERMISLFDQLNINQDLLYALIDWIDSDSETITSDGAEDDHYLNSRPAYRSANNYIINLDEILLIKGFDKTILRKLKPHLTAIPNQYKTNINTINSETISSLHPMIGLINAEKIIRHRNESPFKNIKDFAFFLKYDLRLSDSAINEITSMMTTNSENFRIYGKITMSGHNLDFLTNVFHSLDTLQFVKHNRVIQKIELM